MLTNIITIISIIVTLFSTIISIYSLIKLKKNKRLVIKHESNVLVSKELQNYGNFKIYNDDEEIHNISKTFVYIKNCGTDVLEPSDLAPSSPITITSTERFLLNDTTLSNIYSSNPNNRVSLKKINKKTLLVEFDFLNRKDQIKIILLHTGTVTVTGHLKQQPTKKHINVSNKKQVIRKYTHTIFLLIEFILILGLISLDIISQNTYNGVDIHSMIITLLIFMLVFAYVVDSNNKY